MHQRVMMERLTGGGRVKGGMIKAHMRWVEDHGDQESFERFRSALPPVTREKLTSVLAIGWYDFADLVALDRTIVDVFGYGDPFFARELGRYSASLNLRGAYRFYQRQTIHAFLEASARVHSSFQDFGAVEYVRIDDTASEMRHKGYPSYSPIFCQSAIGYYEEAILLHKGRKPAVNEVQCHCRGDESCTFVLRWADA